MPDGSSIVLTWSILVVRAGHGGRPRGYDGVLHSGAQNRTFQPSELGKVAIIIVFGQGCWRARKTPMFHRPRTGRLSACTWRCLLVLIVAQPDFGTALVYLAIFCVHGAGFGYQL